MLSKNQLSKEENIYKKRRHFYDIEVALHRQSINQSIKKFEFECSFGVCALIVTIVCDQDSLCQIDSNTFSCAVTHLLIEM